MDGMKKPSKEQLKYCQTFNDFIRLVIIFNTNNPAFRYTFKNNLWLFQHSTEPIVQMSNNIVPVDNTFFTMVISTTTAQLESIFSSYVRKHQENNSQETMQIKMLLSFWIQKEGLKKWKYVQNSTTSKYIKDNM